MFSVIFEVRPRSDRFDDYLGLAKQLRPKLEAMDGFIENERFRSRSRDGWVLSLRLNAGLHYWLQFGRGFFLFLIAATVLAAPGPVVGV